MFSLADFISHVKTHYLSDKPMLADYLIKQGSEDLSQVEGLFSLSARQKLGCALLILGAYKKSFLKEDVHNLAQLLDIKEEEIFKALFLSGLESLLKPLVELMLDSSFREKYSIIFVNALLTSENSYQNRPWLYWFAKFSSQWGEQLRQMMQQLLGENYPFKMKLEDHQTFLSELYSSFEDQESILFWFTTNVTGRIILKQLLVSSNTR